MKATTTLSLLLLAAICSHANAENLVAFEMTATVDSVSDSNGLLAGGILVGDTLTGIVQYDLDLLDINPDANVGDYLASPPGNNFIQGTKGGVGFFQTIDFMDIRIVNDSVLGDMIEFFATGDSIPSTLVFPGVDYVDVSISLQDMGPTTFADDTLPSTLDIDDFEVARFDFSAENATGGVITLAYEVTGTITSITRVPTVPEPGTFVLGAMLAVGILIRRKGRR